MITGGDILRIGRSVLPERGIPADLRGVSELEAWFQIGLRIGQRLAEELTGIDLGPEHLTRDRIDRARQEVAAISGEHVYIQSFLEAAGVDAFGGFQAASVLAVLHGATDGGAIHGLLAGLQVGLRLVAGAE